MESSEICSAIKLPEIYYQAPMDPVLIKSKEEFDDY